MDCLKARDKAWDPKYPGIGHDEDYRCAWCVVEKADNKQGHNARSIMICVNEDYLNPTSESKQWA